MAAAHGSPVGLFGRVKLRQMSLESPHSKARSQVASNRACSTLSRSTKSFESHQLRLGAQMLLSIRHASLTTALTLRSLVAMALTPSIFSASTKRLRKSSAVARAAQCRAVMWAGSLSRCACCLLASLLRRDWRESNAPAAAASSLASSGLRRPSAEGSDERSDAWWAALLAPRWSCTPPLPLCVASVTRRLTNVVCHAPAGAAVTAAERPGPC